MTRQKRWAPRRPDQLFRILSPFWPVTCRHFGLSPFWPYPEKLTRIQNPMCNVKQSQWWSSQHWKCEEKNKKAYVNKTQCSFFVLLLCHCPMLSTMWTLHILYASATNDSNLALYSMRAWCTLLGGVYAKGLPGGVLVFEGDNHPWRCG